jgi:hypothetical protein
MDIAQDTYKIALMTVRPAAALYRLWTRRRSKHGHGDDAIQSFLWQLSDQLSDRAHGYSATLGVSSEYVLLLRTSCRFALDLCDHHVDSNLR